MTEEPPWKKKSHPRTTALIGGLLAGTLAGLIAYIIIGLAGFILAFIIGDITGSRAILLALRSRQPQP